MKLSTLKLTILFLSFISLSHLSVSAQTQIIYAGQLLQIPGEAPLNKQTLVVVDGIITSVD